MAENGGGEPWMTMPAEEGGGKKRPPPVPAHIKYRMRTSRTKVDTDTRMRPSEVIQSLTNPRAPVKGDTSHLDPPRIVDFLDLQQTTTQVVSTVAVDRPIFQPYPNALKFTDYEPFGVYEQTLYFRNSDGVARRIRVLPPDSPFFEVIGPRSPVKMKELKQSKVAAGMEVCFVVKFRPQEVREYNVDLVCVTEREKFIVPIHAMGPRAVLKLPDSIDFGLCPVKSSKTKTIIAQNVGTKQAHFTLSCTSEEFTASPAEGIVEVGATIMIEVAFTALNSEEHTGDLVVSYEDGDQVFVSLQGTSENVDVSLGSPSLALDPAYISLSSQKTVKVFNNSEIPVRFTWKQFVNRHEEEAERARLQGELETMQELETEELERELEDRYEDDDDSAAGQQTDEEDLSGDEAKVPSSHRAARAALSRKYKNLRRALEEDTMAFADQNFEIKPLSGEIWANSEIEVTVTFRPDVAADYATTVYLDIMGREERLPLWLTGVGIGPKAILSYDVLDMGDLFVTSSHTYTLSMENKGDIPAEWKVPESSTPFGKSFAFTPSSGVLGVGAAQELSINFTADILGEFSETFNINMKGSDEPLACQAKGHVIGPTFTFSETTIDFEVVSYSFTKEKVVTLTNTSTINMEYALSIPQDGTFVKKEFTLDPDNGFLKPGEAQDIRISLCSRSVKRYEYYMTVDVLGVGDAIVSLPILAECSVPEVAVKEQELSYGECFLRHPYEKDLVLVNLSSELSAQYTVMPQEPATKSVAEFHAEPESHNLAPGEEGHVKITLKCTKLGHFRLPVYVTIEGSVLPPLQATIGAEVCGPRLVMDPPELKWGTTDCLLDTPRTLAVTNNSLIPAPFKMFVKNARSKFRVDMKEGVLAPHETTNVTVTANLDDTIVIKDQLHVIVTEGENIVVPLVAKGTGTTMHCHEDLSVIDFGSKFTSCIFERRITLENKGRRPQSIKWFNQSAHEAQMAQAQVQKRKALEAAAKGGGNKPGAAAKGGKKAAAIEPTFTVHPAEIDLRPRTAVTFIFRGYSSKQGEVTEKLVCESKVGKEKDFKVIFRSKVTAVLEDPLLEFSHPDGLAFEYTYHPDVPIAVQEKSMTLTNRTQLPLSFALKTQVPFSLDAWDHTLDPGEATEVTVFFDPGYKGDRQSQVIDTKIAVAYADHPQRDSVRMYAEINFPNLEFEYNVINFGSVLNDTTKTMVVRVTNVSKIPTNFWWSFIEDEDAARSAATARKPYIPVNQVFDILPIRSALEPGESEDVEFMYYGHALRRFKGNCLCEVQGGPEYELTLLGEASVVGFKLDRSIMDFGRVLYNKREDKEFCIINTGRVAFSFKISLAADGETRAIDVAPSTGKVFPNDKQRVIVRFKPGVPDMIHGRLLIEIAHFEPVELPVYGQGYYMSAGVSLPRDPDRQATHMHPETHARLTWPETLEMAHYNLEHVDTSKLPPPLDEVEAPPCGQSQTLPSMVPEGYTGRMTPTGRSTGRDLHTPGMGTGRSTSRQNSSRAATSRSGVGMGATLGGRTAGTAMSPSRPRAVLPMDIEQEANRLVFIDHVTGRIAAVAPPPTEPSSPSARGEGGLGSARRGDSDSPNSRGNRSGDDGNAAGGPSRGLVPALQLGASNGAGGGASGGVSRDDASAPPTTAPSREGRSVASRGAAGEGGKKTRRRGEPAEWVVAWHVCDFGNVVSGNTRKRVFRVTNTSSSGQLSWVFDKNILLGTGFSCEPEKVVRLPEGESVEFTVNFNAKKSIPLGLKEVMLPLDVKNGPSTVVVLKANVTVPEVHISADTLDFGDCWVGCSRTLYIQVQNVSPVTAEWDFKKAMGNAKDEAKFRIEPRAGVLHPGQRQNVSVEFLPLEQRPHAIKFPLKVAQSSKTRNLTLEGRGVATQIVFSPSLLELGPILPYSEEGFVNFVTMTNASERPVEVYSVDFDKQYIEEENLLRYMPGYGPDDMMRLPVRMPGDPLPDYVRDEYERAVKQEQQEQASALDDLDGEPSLVLPTPRWERDTTPREEGLANDTVIIGPGMSGSSALSRRLASRYGYLLTTLDQVVEEAARYNTELGKRARKALGRPSPSESREFEARITELQEVVRKQQEEDAANGGDKKKKKGPAEPTPEETKLNELLAERDAPPMVPKELLVDALAWRVDKTDAGRGIVFDTMRSTLVSQAEAVASIAEAVPHATVASLTFDDGNAYAKRLERLHDECQTVIDEHGEWTGVVALEQAAAALAAAGSQGERTNDNVDGDVARNVEEQDQPTPSLEQEKKDGVPVPEEAGEEGVGNELEEADDAEIDTSQQFEELDDMTLGVLDDDAKQAYQSRRKGHYSALVRSALRTQERVLKLWRPGAGLVTAGAAACDALTAQGGEGGPSPTTESSEDAAASDDSYAAFEKALAVVKSHFQVSCSPSSSSSSAPHKAPEDDEGANNDDKGEEEKVEGGEEAALEHKQPVPPQQFLEISVDAEDTEGVSFEALLALIPESQVPEQHEDDVPPPRTRQLIKRPAARPPREPQRNFNIIGGRMHAQASSSQAPPEGEEGAVVAKGDGDPSSSSPSSGGLQIGETKTRWVLGAGESVEFGVRFMSTAVGTFNASLGFEVLGLPLRETQLQCLGICQVPTINDDPRNVFMSRIKSRPESAPPVSKRFVMNRNVYEFGPLLTWKPRDTLGVPDKVSDVDIRALTDNALASKVSSLDAGVQAQVSAHAVVRGTNSETFRVSNNGPFDATVSLGFESSSSSPGEKGDVFLVEPREVKLQEGDTCDVRVWAFPPDQQTYKDRLVVCVSQNPFPTVFDVTCVGTLPVVALHGPWERNALGATTEVDAGAEPAEPKIDFDRLLLGRTEDLEFEIKNTGYVGSHWRLDLSEIAEVGEFSVVPREGTLIPNQSAVVKVSFSAREEKEFAHAIHVDFTDVENGSFEEASRVSRQSVALVAEAYEIKAVAFEAEGGAAATEGAHSNNGEIDFKAIRVGDTKTETFTLRNNGKYDITFNFNIRKAQIAELFAIEPVEGTIDPGGSQEVQVSFCATQEVHLRDNKDIRCVISEPHTGEDVESFNVSTSVRTCWSIFRLQPGRGITFGAVKYSEKPEAKQFELKNEGQFAFAFALASREGAASDEEAQKIILGATPRALLSEEQRGAVAENVAPALGGAKAFAKFSIEPWCGTVEPGQTMGISVNYDPRDEASLLKEFVSVLVSGANPEDSAVGAASNFEVLAESCFPVINNSDYRAIFEEQSVMSSLSEAMEGKASEAELRPCFCVAEKLFTFGAVVPSSHPKGLCERIKISNPNKIPCSVDFKVSGVGSGDGPNDAERFELSHTEAEIAPHEHTYVSVWFKPSEIRTYRARFTATVRDGESSGQEPLSFLLAGRGTLPCVTVEQPLAKSESGQSVVDFGRVHVGRAQTRTVTLSNDGIVPSVCLFEKGEGSSAFSYDVGGTSTTLKPGEKFSFDVAYRPREDGGGSEAGSGSGTGAEESTMRMTVMHNHFEATHFAFKGESYANDVLVEDVEADELNLGEYDLDHESGPRHMSFSLRNRTGEFVRFQWQEDTPFAMSPAVGHIPPGASKDITVSFAPSEKAICKQVPLSLTSQRIAYTPAAEAAADGGSTPELPAMGWDAASKVVRPATKEELSSLLGGQSGESAEAAADDKAKKGGGKKKGGKEDAAAPAEPSLKLGPLREDGVQMVEESIPEPAHEAQGEPSTQELKCSAVADVATYECDTKQIVFKPTAMYQTRTCTFAVRNPTDMSLRYEWTLQDVSRQLNTAQAIRTGTPASGVGGPIPCPFSITPAADTIPAQSSQTFTASFAPEEVDGFAYVLEAHMPSLPSEAEPLRIGVQGKSNRPVCHFDLADASDYMGRRPASMKNEKGLVAPIEASSVRVIELTSRGTRVRNTRRFYVMNPTSSSYEFTWEALGESNPAWRCATPKGVILAGKKGEMIFEYTPESHEGYAEAFYRFKIPQYGLEELFLLTGSVQEPQVEMDRTRIDFSACMLRTLATERVHIVNHEHLPFSFAFDKMFLGGVAPGKGRKRPLLEVSPMTGLVPPNGRTAIDVSFFPTEETSHNFNLMCNIRRKPQPLNLNVKGEGYAVHARVTIADSVSAKDDAVELQPAPAVNHVDFGMLYMHESKSKDIVISNLGRYNFDYLWTKNAVASGQPILQLGTAPMGGTTRKGERVKTTLEFKPVSNHRRELSLEGSELTLTIAGKFEYIVRVSGVGQKPPLNFSFNKHDFGPCFITPPGAAPVVEEAVLRVSNQSADANLSLDCTFEDTRELRVECGPQVLEPGQFADVPIRFTPRNQKTYAFEVPFLVNGSSLVRVFVVGEGVPARLELADPGDSQLTLGSVAIGEEARRAVKVVNRSKRGIEFDLVDPLHLGAGRLASKDVHVYPHNRIRLGTRESVVLEVRFSPEHRMAQFTEDLLVQYAGVERKLLSVSAAASGMSVSLDTDTLPFGTVCSGSYQTRKLVLENNGDLPARFQWQEGTFGQHFSIEPASGMVGPSQEQIFVVKFQPTQVDEDIRVEGMMLMVDGSHPLLLTCLGACVPQPDDSVHEIEFSSLARKPQVKEVTVKNPTPKPWFLAPVLSGEHWSADRELHVPANSSASCKVTYNPLRMTRPPPADGAAAAEGGGKDMPLEGTLFFALPDGTALLYQLRGTSGPPEAESKLEVSTAAKATLPITLPIQNWLAHAQRFKVEIKLQGPTEDHGAQLDGIQTVDVGPSGSYEYVLKFKAFKEGAYAATVTLTNPQTGEYLFHEIGATVTAPQVMGTIHMDSPVRQTARHLITIDNPLPPTAAVTFKDDWWSCTSKYVRLTRLGAPMGGNKEGTFQVEYRPLLEGQPTEKAQLEFNINELGTYKYELVLDGLPPSAEQSLRFETPLGGVQEETLTLRVFNQAPTSLTCAVAQPHCFQVASSMPVPAPADPWEGQDVHIQVQFEPEALGPAMDTLTVRIPDMGEYRCKLNGVCRRPQPQGPLDVAAGGSRDISIRNVFSADREYAFTVDNPAFTLGAPKATIKAKSTQNVSVKFAPTTTAGDDTAAAGAEESAKLFVSCPSVPDVPPWVYYLRGVPPAAK